MQARLGKHTHTQTHNTNNKRTHGTEQQTVATVSLSKGGREGMGEGKEGGE